jgi:DNA N-6-adenine-methyltransferase Dam
MKSNEWYTPVKYIEAAREVMGSIDLDPASCELANQTVKAARYYTKSENGLMLPWYGNVWLNPPYGSINESRKMGLPAFMGKLVCEYLSGNINQAIALATSRPACKWFDPLWQFSLCFVNHDIQFELLERNKHRYNGKVTHIHGSIFVYLGSREQEFVKVFSKFGHIVKPIGGPNPKPINLTLWSA